MYVCVCVCVCGIVILFSFLCTCFILLYYIRYVICIVMLLGVYNMLVNLVAIYMHMYINKHRELLQRRIALLNLSLCIITDFIITIDEHIHLESVY